MDKITRLLILYSSLINGDEINKTMFCFENDCSPRSFDRDIEDIRLFLSEVYSVSELKYNRMNNTYYMEGSKKQELEVMEYLFIEKILRDVSVLRNDEFSVLKSHLLMNTRDTSKLLVSSNIKSRYKTPAHNKAILKIYGDLELAIRSLKYIRMVYQDDIGEKNISNMIPCNIRYQAGHLYFMGYTEEDKSVNIKLEQIYSFEVLREQTVDERKKVDGYIKAYVERGSLDFGGDSTEIIVECGSDDYKRLCNNFSNVKVLHELDNRVKIRFDSSEEKFIYWYFEHWSESTTIIAPLQIKEKLITQAQKILRKYGGTD